MTQDFSQAGPSLMDTRDGESQLLRRMLGGHPVDAGTYRGLRAMARKAENRGDLPMAESFHRLAVLARPASGEAWRDFAMCLGRTGAVEEAVTALRRAVEIDARDGVALARLGQTLVRIGAGHEASQWLRRAVSVTPFAPDLADALEEAGISRKDFVRTVLENGRPGVLPGDLSMLERLDILFRQQRAGAALRQGRLDEAVARYEALGDLQPCARRLVDYGDAVLSVAGLGRAGPLYLRAALADPDDERAARRAADVAEGNSAFVVTGYKDVAEEKAGALITTSDDGQLILGTDGRAMPAGWTLITLTATALSGRLRPVIYAFHGAKGREIRAFTLPVIEGRRTVRCLVPLPQGVVKLRLDPCAHSGVRFRLDRVAWRKGEEFEGAAYAVAPIQTAWVGEAPPPWLAAFDPPRQTFTLIAQGDLEEDGKGGFLTTGPDPQCALAGVTPLPSGWTWFEIQTGSLSAPLGGVLYAWNEGAIHTLRLPTLTGPGNHGFLIRLPEKVTALRYDPAETAGVAIGGLTLRCLPMPDSGDAVFLPLADAQNAAAAQRRANALSTSPAMQALPVAEAAAAQGTDGAEAVWTREDGACVARAQQLRAAAGLVRLGLQVDDLAAAGDAVLVARGEAGEELAVYRFTYLEPNRHYDLHVVLPGGADSFLFAMADASAGEAWVPRLTVQPVADGEGATYTLARGQAAADAAAPWLFPGLNRGMHVEEWGDGYRSSGDDPQFGLAFDSDEWPGGWTVVSVEMDVGEVVVRPMLFVWTGDAVTPVSLAPMSGSSRMVQLVWLPLGATAMRFDPMDQAGVVFSRMSVAFAPPQAMAGRILQRNDAGGRALEYSTWVEVFDTLSERDRELIRESIDRMTYKPLISVLMPVFNPEPRFLRRALDTVIEQLYPHWELCIAEDLSPLEEIRGILREYAARDSRIKVVFRTENGHISKASNSALELVEGEFIALMDHDDEIPPHALYLVAEELNRHPDADILYSDEDKVDANGRRHDPHFKTDWNQELFYSQNMVAHLGVYRTTLVRAVGGFRAGFEGSQDYDFTLRVLKLSSAERIRHIPHVLYHWRIFEGVRTFSSNNPLRSVETARQGLLEYFAEVEPDSVLEGIEAFPSWWRIRRPLPAVQPLVTVVIPTRDKVELVRACVEGLLYRTDYRNFHIIIVDNGSVEAESLTWFAEVAKNPQVSVRRDDGPFNYSRLNNDALVGVDSDYVLFLNNDIEVIRPEWLGEMVSQATQPGVGAVGARLLYGHGTIQHAGVTLGIYGVAAHGHRHFEGDSIGYFGHPQLVREVSAVTAAALLMPLALFRRIGGFDAANLAVSYNDVDLCLRIGEAGYRVVYTPFAKLFHLESVSRGPDVTPAQKELQRIERGFMEARWTDLLHNDPFYSPNLTQMNEDYRVAFPPRARKPWRSEADVAERVARVGRALLPARNQAELAALAADTAVVIGAERPFAVLRALGRCLAQGGIAPAEVVVVDNTPRKDRFVREGAMRAFAMAHPDVQLTLVDDSTQDFNGSRTGNLGLAGIVSGAGHVLMICEDCQLTSDWLTMALACWQAAGGGRKVVSAALFVRENQPRQGVYYDGFVEAPCSQVEKDPHYRRQLTEGYADLPWPGRVDPALLAPPHAIQHEPLLGSGVFMARRDFLDEIARQPTLSGEAELFDPLLFTAAARHEDLSYRIAASGGACVTALAPLVVLDGHRPQDLVHLWQYWHDYHWLNTKVHGLPQDGTVEFVCPFHRGDVLIGLQVAHTAHCHGVPIRMHVAEGLVRWIQEFAPPFLVIGLPVPVPPAQETMLQVLRGCEDLMKRMGAGAVGPRVARSHPFRSLDTMNGNLATAMVEAVGLPRNVRLLALAPEPTTQQAEEARALLAPFGKRVILLHRSGGWGLKTLPETVLAEFSALVKREGFRLVQIGGPGDEASPLADGSIIGPYASGHWAALFRMASAVAGIDSWSSHMAALLDVPQITFFGSTHPDHVSSKHAFAKRDAPALLIRPKVTCSPCNSLSCLIQSEPFCPGFGMDAREVEVFLRALV